MSGNWLVSLADMIGGFASGVATGVGAFALLYARRQLQVARETDAEKAYQEYLQLCLDHPKLSSGKFLALSESDHYDLLSTTYEDLIKYRWFLALLLTSCEKILKVAPDDREWEDAIRAQLECHKDGIFSIWEEKRSHYTARLRGIVGQVIGFEEDIPQFVSGVPSYIVAERNSLRRR